MTDLLHPNTLICLTALTALEIVLGIDNVVFIAILVGKLPPFLQLRGWRTALTIAMVTRIALLLGIGWMMRLGDAPLFTPFGHDVSARDLILILGGLFLIAKATYEIHDKLEGAAKPGGYGARAATFARVMLQVIPLNLVFSLDSVITAVGMTTEIPPNAALVVMITAIVVASLVMMLFSGAIGRFVERHPTIKMLGLAFLLLIGVMLVAEGFHNAIPKGYIYFAMAFSLAVEMLNIRVRKSQPVQLHQTYVDEPAVHV